MNIGTSVHIYVLFFNDVYSPIYAYLKQNVSYDNYS